MEKRIVVGFDGSDEARRAACWAAEFARMRQARLDLVAVVRPPDVASDVETEDFIERSRQHYAALVESMRELLAQDGGGRVTAHVLVGHPAERLICYAEEHKASHIVVGHRNRSAIQRWLVGSVARQVMDHASCSVTIVR